MILAKNINFCAIFIYYIIKLQQNIIAQNLFYDFTRNTQAFPGRLFPASRLLVTHLWFSCHEKSLIAEDGTLSASAIADIIGITPKAVEKHIARLKAEGIIKRIGPDKGGHWVLSEQE